VKFLIDNSLSPLLSEALQTANHDAVHIRDYGLQKSEDEVIFDRAANEDRVVVSADTDFGTILVNRQTVKPSVILFRGESPHRPELQAALLLANLANLKELLERGSIIIFEAGRLRVRSLPILQTGRS